VTIPVIGTCYHQACDSLTPVADGADPALYAQLAAACNLAGNVNLGALEEMSDAAAHALLTFAMTTSAVNGSGRAADPAVADQLEYQGSNLRK
jgi:hypothetical protein